MVSEQKKIRIMMVAGEDSGDSHAAALAARLRERFAGEEIEFFGAAGIKMREAGVEAVVRSDDFGIFGVFEVLRAVPMFLEVLKKLSDIAKERNPDLVLLVDFPEFNLKLAKRLKKNGFKVVYFISPQLWAWRGYRIRSIKRYVDLLLVTLPFERDWYEERRLFHVAYVGNPLAGKVINSVKPGEFKSANKIDPGRKLVALLPGSRAHEIKRNFPVMLAAARILNGERGDLQFCVGVAASRTESEFEGMIANEAPGLPKIIVLKDSTYDLLYAADAAVVASGTATLETAMIGTPQVIVYRSTAINYALLRPLVSVPNFGLANLIAGKTVFKEFIQNQFNPRAVADEISRMLEPGVNADLRQEAALIREKIGESDAARRAAEEIARFSGRG